MTATTPPLPRPALAAVLVWFAAAALIGISGALAHVPFPAPQVAILFLIVASIAVTSTVPAIRAWIDAVPLRTLVGINALRFVGIVFLILAARGQLAQVFADRAGWGDIAAAALALVLVVSGDPRTPGHRAVYHAWNLFGAADLITAVATAGWVAFRGLRPGMEPVIAFPLSLIPFFFVPAFLAVHVVIFRRLKAAGQSSGR